MSEQRNNPKDFAQKLDQNLPSLLQTYKVPGLALSLIEDGEVILMKGYGYRDRQCRLPVRTDTVFQVGSISKPIAAIGVMKLVEKNLLNLKAPVEDYLTRWHLPQSSFNLPNVTIDRLLSHTAGLSVHGYPGFDPKTELPSLEESLSGKTGGVGRVYIQNSPGRRFMYSGGGYTLLQLVVEEVTGRRFHEYMEEEVLLPLSMKHSAYIWRSDLQKATARAYDYFNKLLPNYLFTAQAAAGLYSTIADLSNYMVNMITLYRNDVEEPGIIAKQTLQKMLIPVKRDYGLGYFVENLSRGERLVNHAGSNQGWKCYHGFMLNRGSGIILLTNGERGQLLLQKLIEGWVGSHSFAYRWPFAVKKRKLRSLTLQLKLLRFIAKYYS